MCEYAGSYKSGQYQNKLPHVKREKSRRIPTPALDFSIIQISIVV